MRILLKSKIHKAHITFAHPDYIGSITIDEALMEKADLWEGEKVLIANGTNGVRLETYVIKGKKNSGMIGMNGPAANLMKVGDEVVVMGFAITDEKIKAKNILVDEKNSFVRYL